MMPDMSLDILRNPNRVRFSRQCSVTGEYYGITISEEHFVKWKIEKKLIQDVMPELTDDQREFLISGYNEEETMVHP